MPPTSHYSFSHRASHAYPEGEMAFWYNNNYIVDFVILSTSPRHVFRIIILYGTGLSQRQSYNYLLESPVPIFKTIFLY